MSRLQLALRVSDLDHAVPFYEQVFATPVTKRRPGYANFAIADPPLKLVLLEGDEGGTLDHLGIETLTAGEQDALHARWEEAGLAGRVEQASDCCYATQDKAWTSDPDGLPWEVYRVLGDADVLEHESEACCA